ncbi:MAG: cadmium-translocating P-type ATPase [Lysobacter sp.]|nr:cadmium-translocating P-type ATPase [Lysobacter sp.]
MTDSAHSADRRCAHCGQPAPNPVIRVGADGASRAFCCAGCAGLHDLAGAAAAAAAAPAPPAGPVRTETVFDVEGVSCAACVTRVESALARLPGVEESSLNLASRRVRIRHSPDLPRETLAAVIARAGYRARVPGRDPRALRRAEERRALWRLSVAGLAMMQVMMLAFPSYVDEGGSLEWDQARLLNIASLLLTVPVLLFSSGPIFRAAWHGLAARAPGMDFPVALGIAVSFAASVYGTWAGGEVYYDSITMFVFFILCGRYFEARALSGTVDAADSLAQLLPRRAWKLSGDERVETDPAALVPGDLVSIPAGESAPADASVVSGATEFDESLLTGETYPVQKRAGDKVLAGSINLASPVTTRVDRAPGEATLDLIRRQMERAASQKPRWAILADRIATHFVVVVVLLAALGAVAWYFIDPSKALWVAVATLVVTCPCALSLATPVALTACVNALSRHGVMVTSGRAIEALASATHLVFDKTGTLTTGRMHLRAVEVLGDLDRAACLAMAASLESALSHPIAHALVKARPDGVAVPAITDIRAVAGAGVEARAGDRLIRVGSPAFCAEIAGSGFPSPVDSSEPVAAMAALGRWLAAFHFEDALRPESRELVSRARAAGCEVVLLSGDRAPVVDRVGAELGIAHRIAGASPEEKARRVEAMAADGAVVAMIGDGINDAPVLARAQVSIALASGAALAQSQADLVVANPSLLAIGEAIELARRTRRIIRQNIGWSIAYNAVTLPLALGGFLTPWLASLGMSLSSLLVVANALRLLRRRTGRQQGPLAGGEPSAVPT